MRALQSTWKQHSRVPMYLRHNWAVPFKISFQNTELTLENLFFQGAGSREFVECDTIMRINHQVFWQQGRNSCGPASVAHVRTREKPEQLVEVIAEVYTTQSSPYLSELNFNMSGSDASDNMHLGSLLVFASTLRDARNQKLTTMDTSTVPKDGYERIRATPAYQPEWIQLRFNNLRSMFSTFTNARMSNSNVYRT